MGGEGCLVFGCWIVALSISGWCIQGISVGESFACRGYGCPRERTKHVEVWDWFLQCKRDSVFFLIPRVFTAHSVLWVSGVILSNCSYDTHIYIHVQYTCIFGRRG